MADAQDRIEKEARFASDVATAVQVLQSRADEMPIRAHAALDLLESQIQYIHSNRF
ncbi:MAG: hypothetical protein ABIQ73_14430 [Acidimicrobiales bacterium]